MRQSRVMADGALIYYSINTTTFASFVAGIEKDNTVVVDASSSRTSIS